jgi:hypothetical protein
LHLNFSVPGEAPEVETSATKGTKPGLRRVGGSPLQENSPAQAGLCALQQKFQSPKTRAFLEVADLAQK